MAVGVQLPADTRMMQMSWRNHLFSGLTWRKDAIVTAERKRKGGREEKEERKGARKRKKKREEKGKKQKGRKRDPSTAGWYSNDMKWMCQK